MVEAHMEHNGVESQGTGRSGRVCVSRIVGRAALVAVGAISALCPTAAAGNLKGGKAAFVTGRPSFASRPMLSTRTSVAGYSTLSRRPVSQVLTLGMGQGTETLEKAIKATDYYKPLVEGDILESTDQQRTIVYGSFAILAMLVAKSVWLLNNNDGSVIGFIIAALVGFEFADFGSGVYHWSMDNYGNAKTPIFGTQIEAFQGHHELPWTITYRQVCNNIYKICQASTPFCVFGLLFINNPYVLVFMATAITFINASQELHKWSHMSPSQAPALVNALQDANIIIGRKAHLAHHKPPFDGNYCIVSGHCNNFLDDVGFFRWLEKVVEKVNGAEPRCWTNERLLMDTVESLGIKRTTTLERKSTTLERSE